MKYTFPQSPTHPVLKEQFKDREFRKAYEEEGVYAQLAIQIARLKGP